MSDRSEKLGFSEGLDISVIRGGKTIYSNKGGKASELLKAFQMDFCPKCGERMTAVVIWFCKKCGEGFLVRYDEKTGKSIIVPMGKAIDREALKRGL